MPWGIGKKNNGDSTLDRQLKAEGGLTAIKGTEYTKLRLEAEAEIEKIIEPKRKRYELWLKTAKNPEERDQLIILEKEIELYELYKQFKGASVPWATAGEDHEMSVRLRNVEIFFQRNLNEPQNWPLVRMALQFTKDLCYKEWHIAPAPTIIFQTPIMPGYHGGIDPAQGNTETVSRNKD